MLVKARFLKDGEPSGKGYTYSIAKEIQDKIEVGTIVLVGNKKLVIAEINVPEESITFPLDKLKEIDALAEQKPEITIKISCPAGMFDNTVKVVESITSLKSFSMKTEFDGSFIADYAFKIAMQHKDFTVENTQAIEEELEKFFPNPVVIFNPDCYRGNEEKYELCKGNDSEACKTCSVWEDLEPDGYPYEQ